jgi:hypothetical protein
MAGVIVDVENTRNEVLYLSKFDTDNIEILLLFINQQIKAYRSFDS